MVSMDTQRNILCKIHSIIPIFERAIAGKKGIVNAEVIYALVSTQFSKHLSDSDLLNKLVLKDGLNSLKYQNVKPSQKEIQVRWRILTDAPQSQKCQILNQGGWHQIQQKWDWYKYQVVFWTERYHNESGSHNWCPREEGWIHWGDVVTGVALWGFHCELQHQSDCFILLVSLDLLKNLCNCESLVHHFTLSWRVFLELLPGVALTLETVHPPKGQVPISVGAGEAGRGIVVEMDFLLCLYSTDSHRWENVSLFAFLNLKFFFWFLSSCLICNRLLYNWMNLSWESITFLEFT